MSQCDSCPYEIKCDECPYYLDTPVCKSFHVKPWSGKIKLEVIG